MSYITPTLDQPPVNLSSKTHTQKKTTNRFLVKL